MQKLCRCITVLLLLATSLPLADAAQIKGGKLWLDPGEKEDRSQCNQFVTVISRNNGAVQVLYHDPETDKLVSKVVPAGGILKISYWDMKGVKQSQIIRAGGDSGSTDAVEEPSSGKVAERKGASLNTPSSSQGSTLSPTSSAVSSQSSTSSSLASAVSSQSSTSSSLASAAPSQSPAASGLSDSPFSSVPAESVFTPNESTTAAAASSSPPSATPLTGNPSPSASTPALTGSAPAESLKSASIPTSIAPSAENAVSTNTENLTSKETGLNSTAAKAVAAASTVPLKSSPWDSAPKATSSSGASAVESDPFAGDDVNTPAALPQPSPEPVTNSAQSARVNSSPGAVPTMTLIPILPSTGSGTASNKSADTSSNAAGSVSQQVTPNSDASIPAAVATSPGQTIEKLQANVPTPTQAIPELASAGLAPGMPTMTLIPILPSSGPSAASSVSATTAGSGEGHVAATVSGGAFEPPNPAAGNYVPSVDTPLGPCAWKRFPIKVFLPPAPVSYTKDMETDIREGFDTWTKLSQNRIAFQFVSSASGADIVIGWASSRKDLHNPTESGEASVNYSTTGSGKRTLKNPGDITSAKITFVYVDLDNKPWSAGGMRAPALHEIGHALGLMGHSQNAGDIMYFQKNSVTEPSDRDVNTLFLLYKTVFGGK